MNEINPKSKLVRINLVDRLRTLVTEGSYRPGERMIERELCERLHVSRTSLREALRQLEAEGLLEIIPNKGPVVRTIDTVEVIALWELGLTLEILIARRIALHGSLEQIAQLQKHVDEIADALKSGDPSKIKASKNSFFKAFATSAHNETLASYYLQLVARMSFLWTSSLMIPGRPAESIREMNSLLSALRTRNPEAAQAALVLYNQNSKAISMYGLRAFKDDQNLRSKNSTYQSKHKVSGNA